MKTAEQCRSIEEVREQIDRLDRQIVALVAERGTFVTRIAAFKKNADEVKAPKRFEQVIQQVVALAKELNADPLVVEQMYRAMIGAFIQSELATHAALQAKKPL